MKSHAFLKDSNQVYTNYILHGHAIACSHLQKSYSNGKGQLISKRLLEKLIWTKIATKKFDNFCPGGPIKKIKPLSYINYGVFNVIKCLYFFDLTTGAEIVKFFSCYFGPNDFF